MKRFLAIAACAVLAASALSACDASDGKVGRGSSMPAVTSRTDMTSRTTSSRTTVRDNGSHTDDGVLHDTASMIGDVGEDIADGADNIGSSVKSDLNDTFNNDSSDNM